MEFQREGCSAVFRLRGSFFPLIMIEAAVHTGTSGKEVVAIIETIIIVVNLVIGLFGTVDIIVLDEFALHALGGEAGFLPHTGTVVLPGAFGLGFRR